MNPLISVLKEIVFIMDQHEGLVAILGIIVTVFIFMRELSNNYFTMEQENFKDIFQKLTLKDLPLKLDEVEQSTGSEWEKKFAELTDILDQILEESKYYKYAIPFFYECLRVRIEEIKDLERYNWKLNRNAVKQNELIQKKCRAIIRNINNASKGRVFSIRIYQNRFIQKIRNFITKSVYDYPADRITDIYMEREDNEFSFITGQDTVVDVLDLKKLSSKNLIINAPNEKYTIIDVRCIKTGDIYFGYLGNIRWGKKIGKTVLKSKNDYSVRIRYDKSSAQIKLNDKDIHKIVLMWFEGDDKNHINFSIVNIRRRT